MQRLKMNSVCAHTPTLYTRDMHYKTHHELYIYVCHLQRHRGHRLLFYHLQPWRGIHGYTCYVMCVMAAVQIFTVSKLFIRMCRKYNNSRVSDFDYSLSYIYIANVRALSFVLHYVLYTFDTTNKPTSII